MERTLLHNANPPLRYIASIWILEIGLNLASAVNRSARLRQYIIGLDSGREHGGDFKTKQ